MIMIFEARCRLKFVGEAVSFVSTGHRKGILPGLGSSFADLFAEAAEV